MKKHITLFILSMLFSAIGISQTQIQGKVTDQKTGEGIILGNVVLYKGGVFLIGAETDFDGNYSFNDLDPGTYDVEVSYVGYNTSRTTGITAAGGKVTIVDIEITDGVIMNEIVVQGYREPLISFDETQQGRTLSSENIEALPTKNIASIAATSAGVSVANNGDISIRGSRPDATVYYIDGIRVNADNASSMVVQQDIEQLQVITGGIGARYGDVTGGAISITSKGPSERFSGGVEVETSEFLDSYGYNLLNARISGPILKKTLEDGSQRSILGFRLFGQYRDIADNAPSAVGVYRASEELIRELESRPINYIEGVAFPAAQFLTKEDIQAPVKAQPNDDNQDLNVGGKIDARISDAIDVSLTGSYYDQSNRFDVSRAWSLFNWVNNPYELRDGFRTNFRFRHKLGSQNLDAEEKTSTIRNASYILQFGYEKGNRSREDFRHEDRYFNYGYYGEQAVSYERRSSEITSPDTWTRPFTLVNGIPFAYQGVSEVPGEFTADPTINPVQAANDYNDINGMRSPTVTNVFGMFNNVGRVYNLAFKEEEDRYTVNVNAGFDIFPGDSDDGKHNVQFGFTYEQRVLRNWTINPMELWTLMGNVTNAHLQNGVDTTQILGMFLDPISGDSLEWYAPNNDAESLPDSKFFKSVREQLGVSEIEFVNPDALDPNTLDLSMFSANELNNFNPLNLNYYGYDYLGNSLPTTTTFEDFFSEVDPNTGRRTFNVAPFTPNYIAGYIQDKFIYKDIVFRLGVRLDYYDANTKVLIDPFAFSDIQSATDFYNEYPDLVQPESVEDDYKVYVTEDGGNEVKAYRDGNVWFKPDGSTTSGLALFGGNIVYPSYKEKDFIKRNPQYFERQDDGSVERFDVNNSFKDYDPQLNIMPRLAFSFPISEDAGFFAHYDVLVQRPPAGASTATALDYYYFNDSQRFSSSANPAENPDLKPEKTIDYEVGFQQKISNSSAIKVSAYYKELRDQVQRRTFNFVPDVVNYETYDNLDFGTVKGFSFGYDLRRTGNFQLNATYTLQFADGTGSSIDSGEGLNSRRNIRNLLPLSNDERHRITAVADYRFGEESGPLVAGKHIFSNAGVNLLLSGISGRPYSTYGAIVGPTDVQIVEAINETRLPWVLNADLQIDKNFKIKLSEEAKRSLGFNVYFRVTNLFNLDNVIDVYQYKYSLSPDDTGWLTSTNGQQARNQFLGNGFTGDNYDAAFTWRTLGQTNYGRPRQIFLGVNMNF